MLDTLPLCDPLNKRNIGLSFYLSAQSRFRVFLEGECEGLIFEYLRSQDRTQLSRAS